MCSRISLYTLSEYEEAVGAEMLNDLLRSYSCPLNAEVEAYLKDENRARHSSLMSSSVTYLAFDSKTSDLLGYFTLMMKSYSVRDILFLFPGIESRGGARVETGTCEDQLSHSHGWSPADANFGKWRQQKPLEVKIWIVRLSGLWAGGEAAGLV